MNSIKEKLADIFFAIAVWLDPRIPDSCDIRGMDLMKYGTAIIKRVDPRKFYTQ